MPFKKGQITNPRGRLKGSRNRSTVEISQRLLQLLDDNIDTLRDDISAMSSKERGNLLIALAKHMTPPAVQPERLTESQLQQIIQYFETHKRDEQNTTKTKN
jgi:hypothetical protein